MATHQAAGVQRGSGRWHGLVRWFDGRNRPVVAYMVAGASAFVAGWLRTRYRKDLARARTRLAAYSPLRADLPAGTVEYAIVGDGTPVLEVHGIFGGFDQGL